MGTRRAPVKRSVMASGSQPALSSAGQTRRALVKRSGQYTNRPGMHNSSTPESSGSEQNEHFEAVPGVVLKGRYTVLEKIGQGTFGQVWRAHDMHSNDECALKIVASKASYVKSAKIEAQIVRYINSRGVPYSLRLRDHFTLCDGSREHYCLVSEIYGMSLYEFMKANRYKGFFLVDIQTVAWSVLRALAELASDEQRIVHTDIKPENILFNTSRVFEDYVPRVTALSYGPDDFTTMRPESAKGVLVDFGTAVYKDERSSKLINTRQYRSPEVIMGFTWGTRSDVWSLACVLVEMYSGCPLFRCNNHGEHLLMIDRMCGPISQRMLRDFYKGRTELDERTGLTRNFVKRRSRPEAVRHPPGSIVSCPQFFKDGEFILESNRPINSFREVHSWYELTEEVLQATLYEHRDWARLTREWNKTRKEMLEDLIEPHHRDFLDFTRYLMAVDPEQRPSAAEALNHPWLHGPVVERDSHILSYIVPCWDQAQDHLA